MSAPKSRACLPAQPEHLAPKCVRCTIFWDAIRKQTSHLPARHIAGICSCWWGCRVATCCEAPRLGVRKYTPSILCRKKKIDSTDLSNSSKSPGFIGMAIRLVSSRIVESHICIGSSAQARRGVSREGLPASYATACMSTTATAPHRTAPHHTCVCVWRGGGVPASHASKSG